MQERENREILLHECHISILMTPVRFIVKEERACKNIAGKLRSLATFGSRAEGCWKVAPGAGLSRLSLPTPHSHSLARPARSLSHTRPFKCFHVVPSKLISGATRHLRRWKFLKRSDKLHALSNSTPAPPWELSADAPPRWGKGKQTARLILSRTFSRSKTTAIYPAELASGQPADVTDSKLVHKTITTSEAGRVKMRFVQSLMTQPQWKTQISVTEFRAQISPFVCM